jgi:hypothetical protein
MMNEKYSWVGLWADLDFRTYRTTHPILEGRLTPSRAEAIKRHFDAINEDISAPYGVSPNGYAYRCGCQHDCCGCLVSCRYTVVFQQKEFGSEEFEVHLEYKERYNY